MKHPFLLGTLVLFLLFAFTACRAGSTSAPGTASVQVTETEFRITSSVTTFVPRQTYHFVVTNHGRMTHEFMILPKSEGSMNDMHMGDMDSMAMAMVDHLNPGETRTLDYTFPSSAAHSHPEFACYFPDHYEAGMKLLVTVN